MEAEARFPNYCIYDSVLFTNTLLSPYKRMILFLPNKYEFGFYFTMFHILPELQLREVAKDLVDSEETFEIQQCLPMMQTELHELET